jgi:hypothetical protein
VPSFTPERPVHTHTRQQQPIQESWAATPAPTPSYGVRSSRQSQSQPQSESLEFVDTDEG